MNELILSSRLKFKKLIKYLNDDIEIRKKITQDINNNLKELIIIWRNIKDYETTEIFFKMKNIHSNINGKLIFDDKLENMWKDYITDMCYLRSLIIKNSNTT